jgi:hypothetical protein
MIRDLAESEHYKVTSQFEEVTLHFKDRIWKKPIYLGDFYGEPDCCIISGNEQYLVVAGCGLIVYRLVAPFDEYGSAADPYQYAELFKEPPHPWEISGLHQAASDADWNYFRFVAEHDEGKFVYRMHALNCRFEKIGAGSRPEASEFEKEMIEEIYETKWSAYQGPEYYNSDRAVNSLLDLVRLRFEVDKWAVYNNVLSGIGNNHAGNYYPAVLKAVPLLLQLIRKSEHELVRNCTLEIITELYCSFGPEPGTFTALTETELSDFVRSGIKQTIQDHIWEESERNKKLINELLEYFREEANQ